MRYSVIVPISSFMTIVTPGVHFHAKGTFILSFPVVVAYAVGLVSGRIEGAQIDAWTLVSAGLITVPILAAARISLTCLRQRREAATLGAKMVPCIRGKWLGNADFLILMQHTIAHGYPSVYTHKHEWVSLLFDRIY